MCRYTDKIYKSHYACLKCRVSVKWYTARECSHCGAMMRDMGRDFHAPRKRDVRRWRIIELTVLAGMRFDSCGCNGPGPRPHTVRDAVQARVDALMRLGFSASLAKHNRTKKSK